MKKRRAARTRKAPEPVEEEVQPAPLPDTMQLRVFAAEGQESVFEQWLNGLKDKVASTRLQFRLVRALQGNFGDHRERIAGAVSEMRIDYGPGYRIYYVKQGQTIVILLGDGTKAGQQADIEKAAALWEESKNDFERHSRGFRSPDA